MDLGSVLGRLWVVLQPEKISVKSVKIDNILCFIIKFSDFFKFSFLKMKKKDVSKVMTKEEKPDIRELTLKNGLDFPTDTELLMMILGNGIKGCPIRELADRVNDRIDESTKETLIKNLSSIKGMGESRALAVAAAVELGRRKTSFQGICIRSAVELLPYVQNYAMKKQEHFLCVTLNGGHEIIQVTCISVGTLNATIIHPREVFSVAIKENAAAIILCHNHPSGNVEPSDADIRTTKKLIDASKIIGIPILDHIIIDCNDHFSFMENGLLFSEGQ